MRMPEPAERNQDDLRRLFAELDAALGDTPVLTTDAATAVRDLRDELDARDQLRNEACQ